MKDQTNNKQSRAYNAHTYFSMIYPQPQNTVKKKYHL